MLKNRVNKDKPVLSMVFVFICETNNMDTQQKLEGIEKIIRELEDIKNSQASVLKKVAQVEAENINLNISALDLDEVHEEADNVLEHLNQVTEKIQTYRDEFVKKHKLDVPETV
jgi:hypothetical protein